MPSQHINLTYSSPHMVEDANDAANWHTSQIADQKQSLRHHFQCALCRCCDRLVRNLPTGANIHLLLQSVHVVAREPRCPHGCFNDIRNPGLSPSLFLYTDYQNTNLITKATTIRLPHLVNPVEVLIRLRLVTALETSSYRHQFLQDRQEWKFCYCPLLPRIVDPLNLLIKLTS